MEDDQIIGLYWDRKEEAIRETDQKYGAYCFSVANHILSNEQDSEECVNDTWLRAWDAMPPGRPSCLRLFLARITRNLSFDKYKARAAKKRGGEMELVLDELEECLAAPDNIEMEISAKELKGCINAFLDSIPERERDIFLRRYFYVDSIGGIAKRYCLKESNVLMILSRSRKRLKAYLGREGYFL